MIKKIVIMICSNANLGHNEDNIEESKKAASCRDYHHPQQLCVLDWIKIRIRIRSKSKDQATDQGSG